MTKAVTAEALRAMLGDGEEIALIDAREQGVYFNEHLFFACSVPLSRLELMIDDLVPRRGTRVVVCDGGEGLAEAAAAKLADFGYSDVAVLEGGTAGWCAAGGELFAGVNVPSKAFGEFVEHTYGTPRLAAEEVKAKIDAGDRLVILDSRPIEEYRRMNIPGGIDVPGAELAYRVHDVAPDPDTLVVVNCAGRTRSIIGAQSLINAGIPNPVVALKDGTMGWHLAGLELERGQDRVAPAPSDGGLDKARAAASRVAKRFGVKMADGSTVEAWAHDDTRTLYVFDVRPPEEFEAGHLPGARNAPGGQLVQATDEYAGTRNARIVLVDDTEVRATMTASWLIQLGWPEVFVLPRGHSPLESGPRHPKVLGFSRADTISPAALMTAIANGASLAILDLATSLQHGNDGHVPGAWWAVRSRLGEGLKKLPLVETLVLTAPGDTLAHLAVKDAEAAMPGVAVKVLDGGLAAWRAKGLPVATGMERPTCETDDVWYKPYDHEGGVEDRMREYLAWEVALVEQIERDGTISFPTFD